MSARALAVRGALLAVVLVVLYHVVTLMVSDAALWRDDVVTAQAVRPQSAEARSSAGRRALDAGNDRLAERLGRAAIARAPMDPDGASVLLQALVNEGGGRAAAPLLRQGGRLGWRAYMVHYLLASDAAAKGDLRSAILQADGLLRQGFYQDQLFPYLRAASAFPGGARALVDRLATGPEWRRQYLSNLTGLGPAALAGHETVLLGLSHTDRPPALDEVRPYLDRLLATGAYRHAFDLWRQLAPPRGGAGADGPGSFAAVVDQDKGSPFDWTLDPAAPVSTQPEQDESGGEQGLRISADDPATGRVLGRMTVLEAGNHLLRWRSSEPLGGIHPRLYWVITCAAGGGKIVLTMPAARPAGQGEFENSLGFRVPPDCPAQRLALFVDYQGGARLDASIGRWSIDRPD